MMTGKVCHHFEPDTRMLLPLAEKNMSILQITPK